MTQGTRIGLAQPVWRPDEASRPLGDVCLSSPLAKRGRTVQGGARGSASAFDRRDDHDPANGHLGGEIAIANGIVGLPIVVMLYAMVRVAAFVGSTSREQATPGPLPAPFRPVSTLTASNESALSLTNTGR
jgi:hypothetical protein